MGFFSALDALLDENSDNSLEKKLGKALDSVEANLGKALDKAEANVKKVDDLGKKAEHVISATDNATKKIVEE